MDSDFVLTANRFSRFISGVSFFLCVVILLAGIAGEAVGGGNGVLFMVPIALGSFVFSFITAPLQLLSLLIKLYFRIRITKSEIIYAVVTMAMLALLFVVRPGFIS